MGSSNLNILIKNEHKKIEPKRNKQFFENIVNYIIYKFFENIVNYIVFNYYYSIVKNREWWRVIKSFGEGTIIIFFRLFYTYYPKLILYFIFTHI